VLVDAIAPIPFERRRCRMIAAVPRFQLIGVTR
jgi:hypothetical protein